MPPKQNQWNNTVPPHHTVQSMAYSDMCVDDFLARFESNSCIPEHVLQSREDDMGLAETELRQSGSTHMQPELLEYQCNSPFNEQTCSILGYFDQTSDHSISSSSIHPTVDTPFLDSNDFQYSTIEKKSTTASPSLDHVPAVSSSIEFSPFATENSSPISKPTPKKYKSAMHRTLSYENVMELDPNRNKSPPPNEPLDHNKVMEALRAKLKKSASPKPKPISEPISPPNTYPTTGVLFLDLKSRRRKPGSSSKKK